MNKDEREAFEAELMGLLEEAREYCTEVLNYLMPHKGWERYDRRIEHQEKLIARIDAALAKHKGKD